MSIYICRSKRSLQERESQRFARRENLTRLCRGNQGGKRLGDETSVSEQKGVMQWTGIKFGARSRLLPWVSSIILVIYEVPEKRRLWFIVSLSYPP